MNIERARFKEEIELKKTEADQRLQIAAQNSDDALPPVVAEARWKR